MNLIIYGKNYYYTFVKNIKRYVYVKLIQKENI